MLTFRTRCLMTLTQGLLIRVHGLPALAMNNCSRLKLLWPTIDRKGIHFAKTKWAIKIKTDVDKKGSLQILPRSFSTNSFWQIWLWTFYERTSNYFKLSKVIIFYANYFLVYFLFLFLKPLCLSCGWYPLPPVEDLGDASVYYQR